MQGLKLTGEEAKLAANKFDTDEIHVLKKTWQDLADRTNGKGIDKVRMHYANIIFLLHFFIRKHFYNISL